MQSMPSLSRTSSTTSISSSDDAGSSIGGSNSRRTRKRFTSAQLTMLEDLFHQNSHPSREQRDAVAKHGGMETKSVTIWFQNKRQMERKVALNNATNGSLGRTNSQLSSSPLAATGRSVYSSSSRLSLDHIASRSELRMPAPRTPKRKHNPNAAIWDNMPSSPIAPPFSPPSREYVEFGKSHRTLEWACAAARLAGKGGSSHSKGRRDTKDTLDWTDDETDEVITPPSTWGGGDARWAMKNGGVNMPQKGVDDDDMMKAALALCGLGRRMS